MRLTLSRDNTQREANTILTLSIRNSCAMLAQTQIHVCACDGLRFYNISRFIFLVFMLLALLLSLVVVLLLLLLKYCPQVCPYGILNRFHSSSSSHRKSQLNLVGGHGQANNIY